MKVNKGRSFVVGMLFLTMAWISATVINQLAAVGDGILLAVIGVIGAYQGTNVFDNFVKGKYYRSELEGK